MPDAVHNSDDLLSHLVSLQDSGNDSIPLGFLIGTKNQSSILIEPIITSLQGIDSVNISFKFDGNKTVTLATSDHSIQFFFKLEF
jgi:hypothetical protein